MKAGQASMFESSDSSRSAGELKYAQTVTFKELFALQRGGSLTEITIVYETYGELNANRDNAVFVCHALTGDSHVARHNDQDDPGWWDIVVGPGKSIDTDRYFVICANILGGCRGTTGPNSTNPETGKPYGADFPAVTIRDIAAAQKKLVNYLGIKRLRATVGGSMGGYMALQWATDYPDCVQGTIALATSAHLTSQALAFDVVGRNAIVRDPNFHGGQYYDKETGPLAGLAIARMLGHITYLSLEAMKEKFDADRHQGRNISTDFETEFSVGSYLAYQGDRFGERFDANSYLTVTMAMDLFELGRTPEDLAATMSKADCRWLITSFSTDWLFPPFQSQDLVDALIANNKPVSYCNIQSNCGHDAFLLPNELPTYGKMIAGFLENLGPENNETAAENSSDKTPAITDPTSIFHNHNRIDYDSLVELITLGASVLDLGCDTGGLLDQLRHRGHKNIMGVELDQDAVLACVSRGLDVVQYDLNQGLASFADRSFDWVVLSQTLQTVVDVKRVLLEMLRVGKRGIVSFPNLGYHEFRRELAEEGRSPGIDEAEGFHWYDTPNVRFLTIADFLAFCEENGIQIDEQIWLDTRQGRRIEENPNRDANLAILALSK
jgi:homoserine O-acetyltransferase/O-succinyltransferase